MKVSIRVSNHHANDGKYLEHDANDFNLSIMVSKRYRKNAFQANPSVILEEYVYMGRQLEVGHSRRVRTACRPARPRALWADASLKHPKIK